VREREKDREIGEGGEKERPHIPEGGALGEFISQMSKEFGLYPARVAHHSHHHSTRSLVRGRHFAGCCFDW